MSQGQRLSELDWLRVLLIVAVFLHHALMPFNGDDWHIMNAQSSKLLDDVMVYFEQLRLPTLFFIAGAGGAILLSKVDGKQYLVDKFFRLFVPLMVGILIIVPPQGYFEQIENYTSYWQAYPELLASFESNHLWFIEYLLVFSVAAVLLFSGFNHPVFKSLIRRLEALALLPWGLFSLVILLVLLRVLLKKYFPDDGHGIEHLSSSLFYLFFFLAGMVCIQSNKVWNSFAVNRRKSLYALIACSLIFYAYYFSPDLSSVLSLSTRWSIWLAVGGLVSWSALLTMLGYAQHYLRTTPGWLKTGNELIYPFYIFHQTVVVVLAFYIVQWQHAVPTKALALISSSFLLTVAICFILVYPFDFTRKMFGLKTKS